MFALRPIARALFGLYQRFSPVILACERPQFGRSLSFFTVVSGFSRDAELRSTRGLHLPAILLPSSHAYTGDSSITHSLMENSSETPGEVSPVLLERVPIGVRAYRKRNAVPTSRRLGNGMPMLSGIIRILFSRFSLRFSSSTLKRSFSAKVRVVGLFHPVLRAVPVTPRSRAISMHVPELSL